MNKFLLIAAIFSMNLMTVQSAEQTYGRIVDLSGSGFISHKGKTREITKGAIIEDGAEIVIEHQGQVTFTDNADHRFHIANSSSVSVSAKALELRAGDLWFQSQNKNDDYTIKTANAVINYKGGEGILSYDTVKGKTQLMVINSIMKISNLRSPELNLSVAEGHFSFIDNAYDEGAPRDPTPVGGKTYRQLIGLFSGIQPMDRNSAAIFKDSEHSGRTVASVESSGHKDLKSAVDPKLIEDYKNSLLSKARLTKPYIAAGKTEKKKTGYEKIEVHVYGQKKAVAASIQGASASKSRAPASVIEQDVPKDTAVSPYSNDSKNQYKESDKLIDQLKKL